MEHLLVDRIGGAREAHALAKYARDRGIVDPAEAYRRYAREILAHNHVALGMSRQPDLVESGDRHAYVSGGWWVVRCAEQLPDGSWGPGCRNSPHPDPETGLAICLNCGRVYRALFPKDRKAIEEALTERPHHRTRNYFWHKSHPLHLVGHKPETVKALHRENRDHGIGRADE